MLRVGISCYQFRGKGKHSLACDPTAQKRLAWACLELCHQYHTPIINDDMQLATEISADGVHLGQDDVKNIHHQPDGQIFDLSINSLEEALYWTNICDSFKS